MQHVWTFATEIDIKFKAFSIYFEVTFVKLMHVDFGSAGLYKGTFQSTLLQKKSSWQKAEEKSSQFH
jgi:hypothetical protein